MSEAYEDVLAKVAPIISPAMSNLAWAAFGAADDPVAWSERLRAAADEFLAVIRTSPDIFFRSREFEVLRSREATDYDDATSCPICPMVATDRDDALRNVTELEAEVERLRPACVVAQEDADRLAAVMAWKQECHICGKGRSICSRCNPGAVDAVLAAHVSAVASREVAT